MSAGKIFSLHGEPEARRRRVIPRDALLDRPGPRDPIRPLACMCCGRDLGLHRLQEYPYILARDGRWATLCRMCAYAENVTIGW